MCTCKLMKSNEMQQYADIYLLQNHSTCFGCLLPHPPSGIHEITQPLVQVIISERQIRTLRSLFGYIGGRLSPRYYDMYQRLQLQFYVLLMMGAVDTRTM